MKKKTTLLLISLFLFYCTSKEEQQKKAMTEKVAQQTKAVASLKFELLQPTPDKAASEFLNRFCQFDTMGASRFVVSFREHKEFYPFSPDPDTNTASAEFAAQMYASGNRKHYFRWMNIVAADTLSFSRIVFGEEQKYPGYSFIKGIKVYLKKPSGAEVEFPMFDTMIKLPGGYKIWSFLDT